MSTITKEQLRERAREKVKSLEFAITQTAFADSRAELEEELELARIALASLEAEPAIHRWRRVTVEPYGPYPWHYGNFIGFSKPVEGIEDEYYYSAPPAPVSVPVAWEWFYYKQWNVTNDPERAKDVADGGVEVFPLYRSAAMLQGAEPVTTGYKLPANTPCKDAPEHIWLQTAGVWPENGEFSELTWCSDNQHPDDTLYVRADVVPGNFTVTPGGWKLVPNDPTTKQWAAGMQAFESGMDKVTRVYKAMIAAAPQQEVK